MAERVLRTEKAPLRPDKTEERVLKIAVLSPHRDDAAFSLSLAVGDWLERGHAVVVVNCFTRTGFAPFSDVEQVHANDRATYCTGVRLREDERWRRQFGKKMRLIDLNLKDASLRLGVEEVDPEANLGLDTPNEALFNEKAIEKIRRELERLAADAVVLPLGIGGGVDHRTAREAGLPQADAGLPCAFYEELPMAVPFREEIEAAAKERSVGLEAVFAGDTQEAIARKRRLALCYDSQIEDKTAEEIAGFAARYGGRERLWANAAWRQAGL